MAIADSDGDVLHYYHLVPIGAVVSWLKNYTNTPSLPEGWVECNGQTLSDSESPYDGQTIPDLNSNNRFLRGNSSSGGTGGESTHTLTISEIPSHRHNITTSSDSSNNATGYIQGCDDQSGTNTSSNQMGTTGGGEAHENKPPYYDVVWIIRIK